MMKATTRTSSQSGEPIHDPALCNTQLFFDRDVEILRCEESRKCEFKRYFNKMVICTCPALQAAN